MLLFKVKEFKTKSEEEGQHYTMYFIEEGRYIRISY